MGNKLPAEQVCNCTGNYKLELLPAYAMPFLQRHLSYLEAVLYWVVVYRYTFKTNEGIPYALLWKMGKAKPA